MELNHSYNISVSALKTFTSVALVVRMDALPSEVSCRLFIIRNRVLVIGKMMRKLCKGFQNENCIITCNNSIQRNVAPVHRIETIVGYAVF
jgi:hypothetical protein